MGFREETRRNTLRLRVFLAVYFVLALFVGLMASVAFRATVDPWMHGDVGESRVFFFGYALKMMLAVLLLAWVQYRRICRSGDHVILALADAKLLKNREAVNCTQEIALAAGVASPRLWVMEDPVPNAFACGVESDRTSIVVTRGLLDLLDRDELQAVVAHEMAHIRNGDTKLMTFLLGLTRTFHLAAWLVLGPLWTIFVAMRNNQDKKDAIFKPRRFKLSKRMQMILLVAMPIVVVVFLALSLVVSLTLMLGFTVLVRFLPYFVVAFAVFELVRDKVKMTYKPKKLGRIMMFVPCGIAAGPAILVVGMLIPLMQLILRLAVSRNREYEADANAVELTRNPIALRDALQKLARSPVGLCPGLGAVTIVATRQRHPLLQCLLSTHPPVEERIRRLTAMTRGTKRYYATAT